MNIWYITLDKFLLKNISDYGSNTLKFIATEHAVHTSKSKSSKITLV